MTFRSDSRYCLRSQVLSTLTCSVHGLVGAMSPMNAMAMAQDPRGHYRADSSTLEILTRISWLSTTLQPELALNVMWLCRFEDSLSNIASPAWSRTTVLNQAAMNLPPLHMCSKDALLPNLFQGNDDGDDAPIFKGQAVPPSLLTPSSAMAHTPSSFAFTDFVSTRRRLLPRQPVSAYQDALSRRVDTDVAVHREDGESACWHCGTMNNDSVYLCSKQSCNKRPFQKCDNNSCGCQGKTWDVGILSHCWSWLLCS
jgi:hypothetical protein